MSATKGDSDGLTRTEMYRWLETYDKKWAEGHERMRNALDRNTAEMRDGFVALRVTLEKHEDDDRKVELRVHDIEERELTAKATVTKRNMFASGFISLVVGPAAAWLFRWLSK